jgi:transposase InsO family protein
MDARARLGWVGLYERLGNAGLVCRRCGISRPTLRKWWRRYQAEGLAGLEARSHRPHRSPNRKVFAEQEALVLRLRRERRLGIKMLRNELARRHGLRLALETIHKVLVRHGENRLERPRLRRKGTRRYSRPVPGDRVPMDTCKIRPGLYQYTAIDDCSRFQVLGLYPRRTAANTLAFPDQVAAGTPFPVQRVQTDRGQEFFAHGVQDRLRERRIKFRPVGSAAPNPRAPHLNGKVERVQRTALEEFWPTVDPKDPGLATRLAAWQGFYNHHRPHGALGAGTPAERIAELAPKIPPAEAVRAAYDPSREFIRSQNTRYRWLPTDARVT